MKQKYRILLPCDFGDGRVRQPGEEVELTDEVAADYGHALMRVESEEEK